MNTKIFSIICVICLLLCSGFALTSCNSDVAVGIISAEINEDGENGSDGKDGEDVKNV